MRLSFLLAILLLAACAAAADPAAPASLASPLPAMDSWHMAAGTAEGWSAGDHVRVTRAGQAVADGVLLSVTPHGSDLVLTRIAVHPRTGDQVAFTRHRTPLPKDPPAASVPRPQSISPQVPLRRGITDWKRIGVIDGLIGDDWMERYTKYAHVYAREGDVKYLGEVVEMLDRSYEVNLDFMGISPRLPMTFYFFPLANPAHTQPKFASRLSGRTRFAGIALRGLDVVLMNLGNWRTSAHYEPWDLEETGRHEMNHLFAFMVEGEDRAHNWHWFAEALAHFIEDSAKPANARLSLAEIRTYMEGYHSKDASFQALIGDRDNDDLEQYRDYPKLLMSTIYFLQDRYGQDVIRRIMLACGRGRDLEDAFQEVTGKSSKALEAEWKSYYGIH
jgi:hypothetical protein